MEKDWNARFEKAPLEFKGYIPVVVGLALFLICIPWALFAIGLGFEDSMGVAKNSSLGGHIRVYTIALVPFLLPAFLLYRTFRSQLERKNDSN
jgi:hypothetical protein